MKRILFFFLCLCLVGIISLNAQVCSAGQTLEQINFEQTEDNGEKIVFKLTGQNYPKIFGLPGENPRVVCDFEDTEAAKSLPKDQKTSGKLVRAIRLGIHGAPEKKVRVVLDMVPGLDYDVRQTFIVEKNEFTVSIYQE